jgi:trimeric autotransporter adhesin
LQNKTVIITIIFLGLLGLGTSFSPIHAQEAGLVPLDDMVVSTIAGRVGRLGGMARETLINLPVALAWDEDGNLFVGSFEGIIYKVSSEGLITHYAGSGIHGYSGDCSAEQSECPAGEAKLTRIADMAVDSWGNLYIVDTENRVVRMVTPEQKIYTVLGRGNRAMSAGDLGYGDNELDFNGRGVDQAEVERRYNERLDWKAADVPYDPLEVILFRPKSIAIDRRDGAQGRNSLFIADTDNHRIRRVDVWQANAAAGVVLDSVYTIAGNHNRADYVRGFHIYGDDIGEGGAAREATLDRPTSLSLDANGNLFFVDLRNKKIKKINSVDIGEGQLSEINESSTINTVFGTGESMADSFFEEIGVGRNKTMRFRYEGHVATETAITPQQVTVGPEGYLFVKHYGNIIFVGQDGRLQHIAGSHNGSGFSADRTMARSALMPSFFTLALSPDRQLWFLDSEKKLVRHFNTTESYQIGEIETKVGMINNGYSDDDEQASSALLNGPRALTQDRSGNLYFSDRYSNRVRKIRTNGTITTIAGDGSFNPPFHIENRHGLFRPMNYPNGLVIDSHNNLYIADSGNSLVDKMSLETGMISTYAGKGEQHEDTGILVPHAGYNGDDKPATEAYLDDPRGLTVDGDDNLYIVDAGNRRIRRVDYSTQRITTFADLSEFLGVRDFPIDIVFDQGRQLFYVSTTKKDPATRTGMIMKIDSEGAMEALNPIERVKGSDRISKLGPVHSLSIDSRGRLYVTEFYKADVWMIENPLADRIERVHVGGDIQRDSGYWGDGRHPTQALYRSLSGIVVDERACIYLSEEDNHVIRKICSHEREALRDDAVVEEEAAEQEHGEEEGRPEDEAGQNGGEEAGAAEDNDVEEGEQAANEEQVQEEAVPEPPPPAGPPPPMVLDPRLSKDFLDAVEERTGETPESSVEEIKKFFGALDAEEGPDLLVQESPISLDEPEPKKVDINAGTQKADTGPPAGAKGGCTLIYP